VLSAASRTLAAMPVATTYNVNVAELGVRRKTLTAGSWDEIVFQRDCDEVEVVNLDGTDFIYFTVDQTDPVDGGNGTYELPPSVGALAVKVPTSGATRVKVLSPSALRYSVTGSL
jgi:hypothetical protein